MKKEIKSDEYVVVVEEIENSININEENKNVLSDEFDDVLFGM